MANQTSSQNNKITIASIIGVIISLLAVFVPVIANERTRNEDLIRTEISDVETRINSRIDETNEDVDNLEKMAIKLIQSQAALTTEIRIWNDYHLEKKTNQP